MKIRVLLGSLYDQGWNNVSLYYPLSLVTIKADNNSDNNREWADQWADLSTSQLFGSSTYQVTL